MILEPAKDEGEIVRRMCNGDASAFDILYRHYYSGIKAHVVRLLRSPELAEDVTQEVFLKIWEQRKSLPALQSFKSYLFICARNHTLNVLKRAARSQAGMGEIAKHFPGSGHFTADTVQENEYMQFIKKRLEALPARTKQVFRLCREQSKTYNEVAEELGITRDAVKSRMMHAIRELKDSADKEMGFNNLPFLVCLAMGLEEMIIQIVFTLNQYPL